MSKVIDALGRIKALCQGYVKDSNDDWNPVRGDYNGGVFAGPFGAYHDRWAESVDETSTGTSLTDAYTAAVPAGYLYILQAAAVYHNDPTARNLRIALFTSDSATELLWEDSVAQYVRASQAGEFVLREGDQVLFRAMDLASGKIVYGRVWGYKVRL